MKHFKHNVTASLFLLAITAALGSSAWADEEGIEFTEAEQEACLDLDRRNKVLDERCQEILAGEGTLMEEEDAAADDEEEDPDRHSAYERELMKKRAAGGAQPKNTKVQRNKASTN